MDMPPLTLLGAFTTWTVPPLTLLAVAVLGGGYVYGVRTVRRRGERWPIARTLAFLLLGLGTALLVTASSIGAYSHVLFSLRAVQVVVLLMVTPLGLALGAPLTLLERVLPERGAAAFRRILDSGFARAVTFPAVTSVGLVITPFLLYLTGWYEAALRSPVLDRLTLFALPLLGFLYFWSRLQLDPVPQRYPQGLSLVISLVEVIGDGALGLILWLGPRLVAGDYYAELARHWGPSPRLDQIIGAGVLWILGDLAGLPFLGASMRRMTQEDAEEARRVDQELDEHMAELASTAPRPTRRTGARPEATASTDPASSDTGATEGAPDGGSEAAATPEPVLMRPWWEDDPVFRERFRRQS